MDTDKKSSPEPRKGGTVDETTMDRELVFHYSREHRLAKASPAVQAMNDSSSPRRPSLISTFTSTKSNRMLLITIAIMLASISIMSRFTREKNLPGLGGNTLNYSAVQSQDVTYLTIKKTSKEGAYTGAVNMVISPAVSKGKNAPPIDSLPIETHRIFFTSKPQEEYGIALPFKADTLVVIMQTETDIHTVFKVRPK